MHVLCPKQRSSIVATVFAASQPGTVVAPLIMPLAAMQVPPGVPNEANSTCEISRPPHSKTASCPASCFAHVCSRLLVAPATWFTADEEHSNAVATARADVRHMGAPVWVTNLWGGGGSFSVISEAKRIGLRNERICNYRDQPVFFTGSAPLMNSSHSVFCFLREQSSSHDRARGARLTRRSVSMQAEDALRQHAGTPQYVLNQLIKQGIDAVPHPRLQLAMVQAFTEMQQGSSPGFQLLRGDTGR